MDTNVSDVPRWAMTRYATERRACYMGTTRGGRCMQLAHTRREPVVREKGKPHSRGSLVILIHLVILITEEELQ